MSNFTDKIFRFTIDPDSATKKDIAFMATLLLAIWESNNVLSLSVKKVEEMLAIKDPD